MPMAQWRRHWWKWVHYGGELWWCILLFCKRAFVHVHAICFLFHHRYTYLLFRSVDKVMFICMFVPKIWNHLLVDATYCEFSLTKAKEKYKSIRDSTLYWHVGLYYAPLLKLKIDAHCGATKMIRQRRASHACPTMTQDELKMWVLTHLRFDMLPSDGAWFRKNVSMRFENPLDASFSFVHVLFRM
jgi:hypothetical protein